MSMCSFGKGKFLEALMRRFLQIRDFVAEQMFLRGVEFHTEESPQAIIKSADGLLSLKTNKGTIDGFSHVLFATGRMPNTKNLGLEEVGVKLAKNGAILADEYSRTSVDSIWAVEDVTDRLNLTPVALMEGGAFAKTVFRNEPTKPDYRYPAYGPEYTYPQVMKMSTIHTWGQQYVQVYSVPNTVNIVVYPYGQLGQPVSAGHGYTAVQGYTVPGHHFVQLGGPNINGVTVSPRPVIQTPYASDNATDKNITRISFQLIGNLLATHLAIFKRCFDSELEMNNQTAKDITSDEQS